MNRVSYFIIDFRTDRTSHSGMKDATPLKIMKEPKNLYMALNLKLMYIAGLWNYHEKEGKGGRSYIYRLYSSIMFFIYFFYILKLSYVFLELNLDKSIKNSGIILTHFPTMAILYSIFVFRDNYDEVIRRVKTHLEIDTIVDGRFTTKFAGKFHRRAEKITKLYCAFYAYVLTFWLSLPLTVEPPTVVTDQRNVTTVLKPLPLFIWTPLDRSRSLHYIVEYAVESLDCTISTYFIAVSDAFCIVLIYYSTAMFEILNLSLEGSVLQNVSDAGGDRSSDDTPRVDLMSVEHPEEGLNLLESQDVFWSVGDLRCSKPDDKVANLIDPNLENSYINTGRRARECTNNQTDRGNIVEKYVLDLVRYHQSLLMHVEELRDLFNPILFTQYLVTSVNLCLVGYELSKMDGINLKVVTTGGHLCCVLLRLGLFCFYGTELTFQSTQMSDSIYSSEWYSCSGSVKKNVQIVLMRAQSPVVLTAGRFGVLSLQTFTKLVQTAYSYFAVLRSLTET
uniref:Odorant receptor n=1 Tax=Timema shepardi TaxID=629360 RepID=A0A7R9AZY5_TIMSH|nr:unnamed protein product [Timema shepardi]